MKKTKNRNILEIEEIEKYFFLWLFRYKNPLKYEKIDNMNALLNIVIFDAKVSKIPRKKNALFFETQ